MNDDTIEPSETWKVALRAKIDGALKLQVIKDSDSTSSPQPLFKTEWHTLFGGVGAREVAEYLQATKKIAQLKEDTFEMEVERERQRRRSLEKSPVHRSDIHRCPSTETLSKSTGSSRHNRSRTPEHTDPDSSPRQAALRKELYFQEDVDVAEIREELALRMLELEERESEIERAEAQVNWRIYALRKKDLELQKKDALMKVAWAESQQRLHEREQQGDQDRRRMLAALAGLNEREGEMEQLRSELTSMRRQVAVMEEKWNRERVQRSRSKNIRPLENPVAKSPNNHTSGSGSRVVRTKSESRVFVQEKEQKHTIALVYESEQISPSTSMWQDLS